MIYKNFKQRQPGTTPIPYNFEVQTAAPIDPRTIVQNHKKLYDTSAWLINNSIKTYLYPGLVITDINDDNTTLKQYVYKGEPFVADSSNPSEPQVPGIWQCITFTNNEQQTIYPLNWKENPNDAGINLNQHALYFGDSSNGEILISNLPNNPNTTFHMSDTGINLFYKDMYHIDIDSVQGISLYKENGVKINLHDDDISINSKQIINNTSIYKLTADERVETSTNILIQSIKDRYVLNSTGGDVSISTLNINSDDLSIKADRLQLYSQDSSYRLANNKIYTSGYTIYYANTEDISNNNLTPTNTIPCIQIFNRDSSDPDAVTLKLNNDSSNSEAYLKFTRDGSISMNADNDITLYASKGDIKLLNTGGGTIWFQKNNKLTLTGGNNGLSLSSNGQNIGINPSNIEIFSNNIKLWQNRYTLPVPDRDKVELLRFNKDKLEWSDSALLKTATIDRTDAEMDKPAVIRIAQAIYTYKSGNAHELWKPSISFAVNTEEGSGIFNAQVLPVFVSEGKVDYMLNIQCINNKNIFNTADNVPYVTGRIYYMSNGQYEDHAYTKPNSSVICEIYVVTSYNTANWAFLSYTHDSEIKNGNQIRNSWKLTESVAKGEGDNTIVIPTVITGQSIWDVTKALYSQYEVLPHIVKSVNFTSVGTHRYSFNEIPYPEIKDFGKFLKYDGSNNMFTWEEAAMRTYNAEAKNYIIGATAPENGVVLVHGTYQGQVYFTNTGDMYAQNYYATSDINKKTDIQSISNNNDNIHTVAFKWKDTSVQSYGFIAQEIEKQHPELVNTDEDGSKTVNYLAALSLYTAQLENRIKILENKLKEKQ